MAMCLLNELDVKYEKRVDSIKSNNHKSMNTQFNPYNNMNVQFNCYKRSIKITAFLEEFGNL